MRESSEKGGKFSNMKMKKHCQGTIHVTMSLAKELNLSVKWTEHQYRCHQSVLKDQRNNALKTPSTSEAQTRVGIVV